MATRACVNCGSEVPEGARVCPVCAFPQEEGDSHSTQAPDYVPPVYQTPEPFAGSGHPAPRVDGQAVAALVLGIVGIPFLFLCFGVIASIVAIFMGRASQKRIEASGGTLAGLGLAKAGWILGIVGVALGAVWILFTVALAAQPRLVP
ncbi:MAG: DUF4190 domain-containing protein [Actinomycetota bacterium]